ncbi:MAG: PP2C family protein-serine/threonine phosphatase [Planctomycetaceae bacterium]
MPKLTGASPDWISGVCRKFAAATNWPLHFTAVASDDGDQVEARLKSDSDCAWLRAIEDGTHRVGFLHLSLPDREEQDRSFLTVCELAEITADLLARTLSASRSLESRTNEVTTLVEIGLSLPNEKDLIGALNKLLRAAVQLTSFRSSCFYLLDPSAQRLNLRAVSQIEPHQIPVRNRQLSRQPPDLEALSLGRVVLQSDPATRSVLWLPDGMSTGVCVAVQSDSGPLGTLWVYDRRRKDPNDREMHVLHSIAAQIATLLERVVLLRESAVKHRLQQDLRVASESQSQDLIGGLPETCGFEAAAVCSSRHEIGGDMCELVSVSPHRTVIVVGDASGDSIPAAIVMSAVRGALRALCVDCSDSLIESDRVVERINRALYTITPSHQFMSLLYGLYDARTRQFTYTNAGHPGPLLMRGEEMMTLKSHGMLLGVTDDATYEKSVLQLEHNDLLVAFSDGVSEAMNHGRKMFRSDGIATVLRRIALLDAPRILQGIWSELELHVDGGSEPDDRTLLVMRVRD